MVDQSPFRPVHEINLTPYPLLPLHRVRLRQDDAAALLRGLAEFVDLHPATDVVLTVAVEAVAATAPAPVHDPPAVPPG